MSRFVTVLPALTDMLERNSGDVREASKELVYENKRERVLGITDARKIMTLVKESLDTDLETEEGRLLVRDGNSLITRTSVDNYL